MPTVRNFQRDIRRSTRTRLVTQVVAPLHFLSPFRDSQRFFVLYQSETLVSRLHNKNRWLRVTDRRTVQPVRLIMTDVSAALAICQFRPSEPEPWLSLPIVTLAHTVTTVACVLCSVQIANPTALCVVCCIVRLGRSTQNSTVARL
jgi:hypothetical protein